MDPLKAALIGTKYHLNQESVMKAATKQRHVRLERIRTCFPLTPQAQETEKESTVLG